MRHAAIEKALGRGVVAAIDEAIRRADDVAAGRMDPAKAVRALREHIVNTLAAIIITHHSGAAALEVSRECGERLEAVVAMALKIKEEDGGADEKG